MGCRSDYMEANAQEVNSKETAQHLVYVLTKLKKKVPEDITKAANDYYGNPGMLNEMVVQLCELLTNLDDKTRDVIVYDGKDKQSRQLADWWDEHQAADKQRIAQEKLEKERKALIKQAKSKLTAKEIAALKTES